VNFSMAGSGLEYYLDRTRTYFADSHAPKPVLRLIGYELRSPILAIGLLLLGCERESTPSPSTVVKSAPNAGPPQVEPVISCAHVVVEPDLISGVLTARNIGKGPPAWLTVGTVGGLTMASRRRRSTAVTKLKKKKKKKKKNGVNKTNRGGQTSTPKRFWPPGRSVTPILHHAIHEPCPRRPRSVVVSRRWTLGEISLATSESAGAPAPSFSGGQPVTFFMDGAQKDAQIRIAT